MVPWGTQRRWTCITLRTQQCMVTGTQLSIIVDQPSAKLACRRIQHSPLGSELAVMRHCQVTQQRTNMGINAVLLIETWFGEYVINTSVKQRNPQWNRTKIVPGHWSVGNIKSWALKCREYPIMGTEVSEISNHGHWSVGNIQSWTLKCRKYMQPYNFRS